MSVDEAVLAAKFDVDTDAVGMANADEVKAPTGWSIGGVPRFCHDTDLPPLADPTFESYEYFWAAVGTPDTMFPIATDDLVVFSERRIVDIHD